MTVNGEMIKAEYAGPASCQVGTLPQYDVRVWWTIRDDGTEGRAKLEAGRELKRNIKADHVEFVRADTSTYNTPHIDSMMTFRVLTREQFAERERLRKLVVQSCALCFDLNPTNYLRMADKREQAVCFTCLRSPALSGERFSTIAFIKANGRLQL